MLDCGMRTCLMLKQALLLATAVPIVPQATEPTDPVRDHPVRRSSEIKGWLLRAHRRLCSRLVVTALCQLYTM